MFELLNCYIHLSLIFGCLIYVLCKHLNYVLRKFALGVVEKMGMVKYFIPLTCQQDAVSTVTFKMSLE